MPSELPHDLDPEELNEMILDIATEMGCPYGANPDLVELGEVPQRVYGFNAGCSPSGVEMYREGQRWRRKAIAELERRPEWIAAWRAAREMDRRVEQLCEAKGLRFGPHELEPWTVPAEGEPGPTYPENHGVRLQWPLAQRLRRQLEAELVGEPEPYDRHGKPLGAVLPERERRR